MLVFILEITNDLIENRKINGVLSGGINGQFTPSVFLKAQAKTVEEFYTQNQYLGFVYSMSINYIVLNFTLFILYN